MSMLATPQTATTTWKVDLVHSLVEFKVKHMMISNVKGQFARVTCGLTLDEAHLTSSRVEASIEAASLNTRGAQRDTHLKSEDFLHAEKFPALSFSSTSITRTGSGELAVAGGLTIRGVTRDVVCTVDGPTPPAQDAWGIRAWGSRQPQWSTARSSALPGTPRLKPAASSSVTM
jgi:polyisoprenoid-binding protein YceI